MRLLIAVAATATVVLGACAGDTSAAKERTISVEMREFGYLPSSITLAPGERVTLKFKNVGTVEHEFMAGRQPTAGKGYAHDWLAVAKAARAASDKPDAHDADGAHAGSGIRIAAKAATAVTLVVPEDKGEFEFGCFIAGHYEGGMKGKLLVR